MPRVRGWFGDYGKGLYGKLNASELDWLYRIVSAGDNGIELRYEALNKNWYCDTMGRNILPIVGGFNLRKKILSTGIITGALALAMSVGAYAGANLEEVKALLNKGIQVELNGKSIDLKDEHGGVLYPITYDGNTYLPVRSIGNAMGLSVAYDADANKVVLGGEEAAAIQEPEKVAPKQESPSKKTSRSHPAAIGTKVNFEKEWIVEKYFGSVSVDEVIRGEEAWKIISQANRFNQEAKDGYEYLLAKITISIDSIDKEGAKADISSVNYTLVSSDGKDYDITLGVVLEDEIDSNLYAGASHTGWAVFTVKKDDANPTIAYARDYDGTGGVWFATK